MYKVPVGKFGFLDGAVIEWLKERIALIAGCALALTMLIVWMVSHRSAADYRTAESIFNRWNGSSGKELVQLSKLLKQHPELHAKYDGRIAQKLLLCSEKGLAASFSQPIFKRVEPILREQICTNNQENGGEQYFFSHTRMIKSVLWESAIHPGFDFFNTAIADKTTITVWGHEFAWI